MIEGRFNILFNGRILPSKSLEEVKANLGRLFKRQPEYIDKLFSQSSVTLKKGVDYATAMKYQSALKQAGAMVLIEKQEAKQEEQSVSTDQEEKKSNLAVEKPKRGKAIFDSGAAPEPIEKKSDITSQKADKESGDALRTGVSGETSELNIAVAGDRIPNLERKLAAVNPDTSQFSLGKAGEELGEIKRDLGKIVTPDLSEYELGKEGELLQAPKQIERKEFDFSGIDMAEAGEPIPTQKVKKEVINPDVSHLKME